MVLDIIFTLVDYFIDFIVKELPALLRGVKYNGICIIYVVTGFLCINLSLA